MINDVVATAGVGVLGIRRNRRCPRRKSHLTSSASMCSIVLHLALPPSSALWPHHMSPANITQQLTRGRTLVRAEAPRMTVSWTSVTAAAHRAVAVQRCGAAAAAPLCRCRARAARQLSVRVVGRTRRRATRRSPCAASRPLLSCRHRHVERELKLFVDPVDRFVDLQLLGDHTQNFDEACVGYLEGSSTHEGECRGLESDHARQASVRQPAQTRIVAVIDLLQLTSDLLNSLAHVESRPVIKTLHV